MRKLLFVCLALAASVATFAQTGTIRGTVTDGENGETLIGANVIIAGTTKGSSTDLDGKYEITNVDPGKVNLVFIYISYENDTVSVDVKPGEVVIVDRAMGSSAIDITEFVVEGELRRSGTVYMDDMRKKSAPLIDGMSSDQIAKAGDNSAASALKRGVGVTVEGGKYVYVRGLSDRYSKTTLNGAEIPGLDPNRNAVQMDLFPTNLIDNLSITKSFSPELPGSFTGGLINIETKDFPDEFTLQVATSVGYNTQASLNSDFLTSNSGATDALGFDDGGRAIPSSLENRRLLPTRFETPTANAELTRFAKAFNKDFEPIRETSGLNQSYSFSVGNQKSIKDGHKIGYVGSLTYRNVNSFYENGITGRYSLTGTVDDVSALNPEIVLSETNGSKSVIWGALFNVAYKSKNHKIGLDLMRNQNGVSTARFLQGNFFRDAQDLIIQTRTLQYQERSINSAQLKGEHYLENFKKLKVDWLGSYVQSKQDEPDLRFFTNDFEVQQGGDVDTVWAVSEALYAAPARYFRDLSETNIDTKVNFELPTVVRGEEAKVKFGVSNVNKNRTFNERRYDFRSQNVQFAGNVEEYLADENLNVGEPSYIYLTGNEGDDRKNSYRGDDNVFGAYGMIDFLATPGLRIITGARFEKTDIEVRSLDGELQPGVLDNADILPALNIAWDFREKMKLRAAYSRTLARPFFRELAPFASFDFVGDFIVIGNPNLQRTTIDNADLRWEFFPRPGEIYSASVFAKVFNNPIERAFNPEAANGELTYLNVDQAVVYGAEVEVRKNLSSVSERLQNFSVGGNLTYVFSQVDIAERELAAIRDVDPNHPGTRTMFGQAPYIVNSFIGYRNDSIGVAANLTFNISGPRLSVVGTKGLPNVIEQARGSLDFNISKQLGERFSLKLSAGNLLNPEYDFTQTFKGTDYTFKNYKIGRTFSIGLKYNI